MSANFRIDGRCVKVTCSFSTGDGHVGSALGGRGRSGVDGREWMADESGRQSNMSGRTTSRMSGSRPGSTMGTRPASSMKRGGHGIGGRRRNTELEVGVVFNVVTKI